MTATAHALIAGAVAATVPNPALGITIAAISHPLVDMIPHWDFGWGWKQKTKIQLFAESVFDLGLGLALAFIFFGQITEVWYLIACVIASEAWDILEAPYWFFNWRFPPFNWVYRVQSRIQGRAKLPWGVLTQAATVIVLLVVLQVVFTTAN